MSLSSWYFAKHQGSHNIITLWFPRSLVILTAARMAWNSVMKSEAAEEKLTTVNPRFRTICIYYIWSLVLRSLLNSLPDSCFGSLPFPIPTKASSTILGQRENWGDPGILCFLVYCIRCMLPWCNERDSSPLSAYRDSRGEDLKAPVQILRAALCAESIWRTVGIADG